MNIILGKFIIILSIIGLVLPIFCLAQDTQMPQTAEEVKGFTFKVLGALPGAVKKVWQEEAWPFLLKMWNWVKEFWDTYLGDRVGDWWQKFMGLLGKEETPDIKKEFQKEKEEMQQDLWQRFKNLLK